MEISKTIKFLNKNANKKLISINSKWVKDGYIS